MLWEGVRASAATEWSTADGGSCTSLGSTEDGEDVKESAARFWGRLPVVGGGGAHSEEIELCDAVE